MSTGLRSLISRLAALAVGVALALVCIHFVEGIQAVRAERFEQSGERSSRDRASDEADAGEKYLILFAALTGVGALPFLGFAVLPTRVLYALPLAGPPRDPRGDADAVEALGRWLW